MFTCLVCVDVLLNDRKLIVMVFLQTLRHYIIINKDEIAFINRI